MLYDSIIDAKDQTKEESSDKPPVDDAVGDWSPALTEIVFFYWGALLQPQQLIYVKK